MSAAKRSICVYTCERLCSSAESKKKKKKEVELCPSYARSTKVSLCKYVFIYLYSFRKLGNWKPILWPNIHKYTSCAHPTFNLSGANAYSVDPCGKHYTDDHSSTKIMLRSQLLACSSVLPVPSNKTPICLCADTGDPVFACRFLLSFRHSSQFWGVEVISGRDRLTVRGTAIG